MARACMYQRRVGEIGRLESSFRSRPPRRPIRVAFTGEHQERGGAPVAVDFDPHPPPFAHQRLLGAPQRKGQDGQIRIPQIHSRRLRRTVGRIAPFTFMMNEEDARHVGTRKPTHPNTARRAGRTNRRIHDGGQHAFGGFVRATDFLKGSFDLDRESSLRDSGTSLDQKPFKDPVKVRGRRTRHGASQVRVARGSIVVRARSSMNRMGVRMIEST